MRTPGDRADQRCLKSRIPVFVEQPFFHEMAKERAFFPTIRTWVVGSHEAVLIVVTES